MNIDELIKLSEKQTELLKELKDSLYYESCLYEVVPMPGYDAKSIEKKYMIFEISTKREIAFGYRNTLLHWFNIRKIPHEKIYNIQILLQ